MTNRFTCAVLMAAVLLPAHQEALSLVEYYLQRRLLPPEAKDFEERVFLPLWDCLRGELRQALPALLRMFIFDLGTPITALACASPTAILRHPRWQISNASSAHMSALIPNC